MIATSNTNGVVGDQPCHTYYYAPLRTSTPHTCGLACAYYYSPLHTSTPRYLWSRSRVLLCSTAYQYAPLHVVSLARTTTLHCVPVRPATCGLAHAYYYAPLRTSKPRVLSSVTVVSILKSGSTMDDMVGLMVNSHGCVVPVIMDVGGEAKEGHARC